MARVPGADSMGSVRQVEGVGSLVSQEIETEQKDRQDESKLAVEAIDSEVTVSWRSVNSGDTHVPRVPGTCGLLWFLGQEPKTFHGFTGIGCTAQ